MTLDTLKREVSDKFIKSSLDSNIAIYRTKNKKFDLFYNLETHESKVYHDCYSHFIEQDLGTNITDDFKELKDIMERVELLEYTRGIRQ